MSKAMNSGERAGRERVALPGCKGCSKECPFNNAVTTKEALGDGYHPAPKSGVYGCHSLARFFAEN
jgi:hypothetical protein